VRAAMARAHTRTHRKCVHARTHTCVRAHAHTHTHTHTRVHAHTHTHTPTHIHARAPVPGLSLCAVAGTVNTVTLTTTATSLSAPVGLCDKARGGADGIHAAYAQALPVRMRIPHAYVPRERMHQH
jgi:hypothetical protein